MKKGQNCVKKVKNYVQFTEFFITKYCGSNFQNFHNCGNSGHSQCSLDGMQGVVFVVPSVYSSNSQLITVRRQFPTNSFIQNGSYSLKICTERSK